MAYLLIPAVPALLWAVSEPLLAAAIGALVAGAAVVFAGIARTVAAVRRDGHRQFCVPHTGVCLEVRARTGRSPSNR